MTSLTFDFTDIGHFDPLDHWARPVDGLLFFDFTGVEPFDPTEDPERRFAAHSARLRARRRALPGRRPDDLPLAFAKYADPSWPPFPDDRDLTDEEIDEADRRWAVCGLARAMAEGIEPSRWRLILARIEEPESVDAEEAFDAEYLAWAASRASA